MFSRMILPLAVAGLVVLTLAGCGGGGGGQLPVNDMRPVGTWNGDFGTMVVGAPQGGFYPVSWPGYGNGLGWWENGHFIVETPPPNPPQAGDHDRQVGTLVGDSYIGEVSQWTTDAAGAVTWTGEPFAFSMNRQ